MNPVPWLQMTNMISYQGLVRTFLREQFIEFNELLLFEDLNLFNQRMAEYLVLYNSKRPHKSLELMTPVDYILRESKNCNMWWTHTPC